jgi:hypothetical protein
MKSHHSLGVHAKEKKFPTKVKTVINLSWFLIISAIRRIFIFIDDIVIFLQYSAISLVGHDAKTDGDNKN